MDRKEVNGRLMKFTDSLTQEDDRSTQEPLSKTAVSCREADHAVTHGDMFFRLCVPSSEESKQQGEPP